MKGYCNKGKSFRKPKHPFEKECLDTGMKTVGEYGLKNKREVWRVQYALAKIRTAARDLLTLDENDEPRIFQGDMLLRRMRRLRLLSETEDQLGYALNLTTTKIIEQLTQLLTQRSSATESDPLSDTAVGEMNRQRSSLNLKRVTLQ